MIISVDWSAAVSTIQKETKFLTKHAIIYCSGTSLSSLVSFLLLPIYTRFLSPYDYGVKELVGISGEIIAVLLATGISSAVVRIYFEYDEIKDRNEVISTSILTIGIGLFVALCLLCSVSKSISMIILGESEYYYYFILAFFSLWARSINNIAFMYLRNLHQSVKVVVLNLCTMVLVISMNIYFIVCLGFGVLGIFLSSAIIQIIIFIFMVLPILCKIGLSFSYTKLIKLVKFGLPIIPSQMGAFIVHLSDRYFIRAFCSIEDAGLYSLGYRFGAIPSNFISVPFNQIWQPRRLEIYKENNSEALFGKIFTYFFLVMSFAGLFVSVVSREVLMVMADDNFWSAYKIVPLIIIATTIFTFQYHLNMGIIIEKKTKYFAWIDMSNALFITILNLIFIPKYGIYGAAYATLCAFIYKISLIYFFSRKFFKIKFEICRLLKINFVIALIFILSNFIVLESICMVLLLKILLVFQFFPILYLIKFFTLEELDYIRSYLSSKFNLLFLRKEGGVK